MSSSLFLTSSLLETSEPNRTILMAGPSGSSRRVIKQHLRRAGFTIQATSRWPQVFKNIEHAKPLALILDSAWGKMAVIEGLRLAKKIYPPLLILVLGPGDDDLKEKVRQEGGEYLHGSSSAGELSAQVRQHLQRHQILQENARLQSQVFKTKAYLAHIMDHLEEAILTTDLQGKVLTLNRSAQQLLNLTPHTLIGRTLKDIGLSGDGLHHLDEAINRILTNKAYEGRFLLVPPHGSPFPIYLRGMAYTEEGQILGTVLVLRDLVQQEELELRLEETERLAALGQIAAGMAHEIRNPLMSVGGFIHRLDRRIPSDHPAKTYIPVILENVRRIENMVREIDEYLGHVQSTARNLEDLSSDEILSPALARLQEESSLAQIDLQLDLWPQLKIRGDRQSLIELFFQLIQNAVEAMPQGGKLRIWVTREAQQGVFQIADTGQGIPPEDLSDIYQPFFTTKLSGAGMGLTKVYMIVERHQGKIEMKSRPGLGTTVIVRLPLVV